MNFFYTLIFLTIISSNILVRLLVVNQEKEIKKIENEILLVESKIEKIDHNIAYDTSIKKLSEINKKEFNLVPILQENIINLNK